MKALYDFNGTDDGELRIRHGDIISVLDNTTFPDWWMGTVRGEHGIFPANYVERIAPPLAGDSVAVLSEAARRLKARIAQADPLGHNDQENESIQVSPIFFIH